MLHYLDDFFLFGAPGRSENTSRAMEWCGVLIADHKTEA